MAMKRGNVVATAELIKHIFENHYSCPPPPMQDILDTCSEGCCQSGCDQEGFIVTACTDGSAFHQLVDDPPPSAGRYIMESCML
jgi:hypothetical protein